MVIIFTAKAQWGALYSGMDIEHVTTHSGEGIRLRLGLYSHAPMSTGESVATLCYDTGSAAFPSLNGTFDAFIISKRLKTLLRSSSF